VRSVDDGHRHAELSGSHSGLGQWFLKCLIDEAGLSIGEFVAAGDAELAEDVG
jgi:hypothetical protein